MSPNPLRDPRDRRLPRIAGPCTVVMFGVTGDLARKKLIPAIYDLANRGLLPPGFGLVGFARRDWGDDGDPMAWCCTEEPEAYVGDRSVVESLADEPGIPEVPTFSQEAKKELRELVDAFSRVAGRGPLGVDPAHAAVGDDLRGLSDPQFL